MSKHNQENINNYIEQYYVEAKSGCDVNNKKIIQYIKSYSNVIVWGASYLGRAIVDCLEQAEIQIDEWWDARAKEIISVDNMEIIEPFSKRSNIEKENTMIIFCIGNTAIMSNLLSRLKQEGYCNVLRGDKLFMGLACPFNIETGIDGLVCNGSMTCRSMFCARLHNIVKHRNDHGGLFLQNLTLMVTTHCSLKCKYCCSYMNSYPKEKRSFFPYDQIARDIDAIFSTVDSIGSITIQGGEPFLHPDIERIVAKLLEKRNFGIVSIATNGIFEIKEEKLKIFRDNRLNVAFSGYYGALSEDKMKIFYKNVELLKKHNVPVTVGVKMPEWAIPPTLWNRNYSEETIRKKKEACKMPERCLQIMNGRLYPCLYSVSLHGVGIADYKEDYVELSEDGLSEKLLELMDKPFYSSCRHCGGKGGNAGMAGEQGFYDFITEREDA